MGFGEDACAGAIANTPKAMRYFGSSRNPKPGWRNWQTQQTQNLPTLVVMGVRPPLPAPLKIFNINYLQYFVPISTGRVRWIKPCSDGSVHRCGHRLAIC